LRLAAPDEPGFTAADLVWTAGAGSELWVHRRLLLRAEALYVGQAARGGTRAHVVAQLGVGYAFPRALLTP
jgi:hypothetical protein